MSENIAIQSEIGPLLEEINKKGVQEAEAKKVEIISDAEKNAAKIIADAKAEAELLIKKAKDEAAKAKEIVESDLKQASRSVQKICKNSLDELFTNAFTALAKQTMESDISVIANIVNVVAAAMAEGKEVSVEVDSAVDVEKLKTAILSKVKKEISSGVDVKIAPGMKGVAVSKKGENFSYEVTPAVVTEAMFKMLSKISKEILESKK
ncbi:MAG: hypothetical protein JXR91_10710 [Deltaproteobacteria bacterium]|nr:hypothetical protein [Deltaproteobacteria bacterium]